MEIRNQSTLPTGPTDFSGVVRGLSQQGTEAAAQTLLRPAETRGPSSADQLDLSLEAQQAGSAAASNEVSEDGAVPRDAISKKKAGGESLKDVFQDFVGRTFFSELIKSLRSTQKGSAYFNGGRAEEIFQGQLDQVLTDHLSDASAESIADPMFEQFQRGRGM